MIVGYILFLFFTGFARTQSQPPPDLINSTASLPTSPGVSISTNTSTNETGVDKVSSSPVSSHPMERITTTSFTKSTDVQRNICTNNFGICMSKDQLNNCSSENVAAIGLCDGDGDICCIPNQQAQFSWKDIDVECGSLFGTCQKEFHACDGIINQTACGGPSFRICCSPSNQEREKWTRNDSSCEHQLGVCQSSNVQCNGKTEPGMCGGPDSRQCCLPSEEEMKEWEKKDTPCRKIWGECQVAPLSCEKGKYQVGELCGGPEARKCCAPEENVVKSWTFGDTQCTKAYGSCQHKESFCNGTGTPNKSCAGPDYRVCCHPSDLIRQSWFKKDNSCVAVGGECQHAIVEACDEQYTSYEACGGPAERRCCVTNKKKSQPHEETPSGSSVPANNSSTKLVLLIVSGLVILVILIALLVKVTKQRLTRSYRRVHGDTWYEKQGNEETVKLTNSDALGTYA